MLIWGLALLGIGLLAWAEDVTARYDDWRVRRAVRRYFDALPPCESGEIASLKAIRKWWIS